MTEPAPPAGSLPAGFQLEPAEAALWTAAAERARSETWPSRLFARDPSLWSSDPAVQADISERFGWL
ncbi:MAG: hypothetical protein ACRDGI_07815, partial [Candidatus Limnocylindrales bacterium]